MIERWRMQLDDIMDAFKIRQSDGGGLLRDGRIISRTSREGHQETNTCKENQDFHGWNLELKERGELGTGYKRSWQVSKSTLPVIWKCLHSVQPYFDKG